MTTIDLLSGIVFAIWGIWLVARAARLGSATVAVFSLIISTWGALVIYWVLAGDIT